MVRRRLVLLRTGHLYGADGREGRGGPDASAMATSRKRLLSGVWGAYFGLDLLDLDVAHGESSASASPSPRAPEMGHGPTGLNPRSSLGCLTFSTVVDIAAASVATAAG